MAALDDLLAAWRVLAEAEVRRARARALADKKVAAERRAGRAEAEFAGHMTRLDRLEHEWQRQIDELERESRRVQSEIDGLRAHCCLTQGELDDIAEIVGVQKDAPFAMVRDRVAEFARASDQLRMST